MILCIRVTRRFQPAIRGHRRCHRGGRVKDALPGAAVRKGDVVKAVVGAYP